MDSLNIVIVGVGGQGTLLASRVLGHIAQAQGYDVKVSEVHGMSQRGGSVITYVRMGQKVCSPLVEQGGADYLLAFEELEALRALPSLAKNGVLIMNTQQILPLPVITGAAEYPKSIVDTLREKAPALMAVDALAAARAAGNAKALNTVLLGVLAKHLRFDKRVWLDALQANIPPKLMEANEKAFDLGYAL